MISILRFSKPEIRDLLKSWLAISLAFAIALSGIISLENLLTSFLISASTVGIGFIFHELSHKYLAQKYGCIAEFRSYDKMLIIAILLSFTGIIFAAPGGVFIQGFVGKVRNGKISSAGIIANISIAFIFLIMLISTPFKTLSYYGLLINSWLALFNLIPIGNFDGKKVLNWNKKVYTALLITAFTLMAMQSIVTAIN